MSPPLERCHALVLNADFRPLSYFPLSLWGWQDAIKAVFLDRVNIVSEYERAVHSPSRAFRLPSVIALKNFVAARRRPAFTRFNVFLRDRFSCQYCAYSGLAEELTFDELVGDGGGVDRDATCGSTRQVQRRSAESSRCLRDGRQGRSW